MADTRTELLDAGERSLAEHGYGGTSIRGIARAVGIKESSVYNHFAGKQALLDAVVDRAESRLDAIAAAFELSDDPAAAADVYATMDAARLEQVALAYFDAWLHDPQIVAARRVLTMEQFRSPAAGRRLRDLTVERPLEFQQRIFAWLMQRGAFRPGDPEAVALAFWGPIVTLLAGADGGDETLARHRLRLHLKHFAATYVAPGQDD